MGEGCRKVKVEGEVFGSGGEEVEVGGVVAGGEGPNL